MWIKYNLAHFLILHWQQLQQQQQQQKGGGGGGMVRG